MVSLRKSKTLLLVLMFPLCFILSAVWLWKRNGFWSHTKKSMELNDDYKTLFTDQNKYLRTSPSTSPTSTKGSTLRSARLQTARAMCKEAEVFPPPGKIKFSKGGKCFVYSSIHSSNSAVCLVFKEGTLSI